MNDFAPELAAFRKDSVIRYNGEFAEGDEKELLEAGDSSGARIAGVGMR